MRRIQITESLELLAEETGIHIGDGSMPFFAQRGKYTYSVRGNLSEREYYDAHVVPLIQATYGVKPNCYIDTKRSSYGFEVGSKQIVEFKSNCLGLPRGPKTSIRVPVVFMDDKHTYSHLLRGIFDTDGSVKKYPRSVGVEFTTMSQQLCVDMKEMLEKLGIFCHVYEFGKRCEIVVLGVRETKKFFKIIFSPKIRNTGAVFSSLPRNARKRDGGTPSAVGLSIDGFSEV